jgi:F-type H+-transporting ATPase subunit gamma
MLLVLTAEQPFCGAFNQNILALAERRWQELRGAHRRACSLVVIGQRGARLLQARGIVPDTSESAATSLGGLRDLVKRLTQMVDAGCAHGDIGSLHVLYSRYRSVSEQVPTEERILPLDLTELVRETSASEEKRGRYYRYLPVPILFAGLISEYAFISLYRMAADSFAGEQAARLVAMDSATRNTEKMLDSLLELERRERQGQITRQVLELVGARFAMQ